MRKHNNHFVDIRGERVLPTPITREQEEIEYREMLALGLTLEEINRIMSI